MKRFIYKSSILAAFVVVFSTNLLAQGEVDGLAPYWRTKGNINVASPVVPSVYGTTKIQSTDHWLGTVGNKDIIVGTDSLERMRIKGTGNVGIGTANPLTTLDVKGGFAMESSGGVTACNSGTVNITVGNRSFVRISSTATIATNPLPIVTLSNGIADGQLLTLYNESAATNVVQMANAANVKLAYSPVLIYGRSASFFVWDATNNIWFETGHVPELPRKQVFTYVGSKQVFTVPAGIKKIHIKMWGGGGGPGFYNSTRYASGGSGGFVEGDLDVSPLQNLQIEVGAGGNSLGTGRTNTGYNWNIGGGAAGGSTTPTDGDVGGGGGASIIKRGSTILAVAGGGGGGAGHPNTQNTTQYGGAGGGLTGGNGGAGTGNVNSNGKGGTQLAGGNGGTGGGSVNGQNGDSQGIYGGNGGNSTGYNGGGGGGGGYYGGGGGSGDSDSFPTYSGGGGGGSSYVGGLNTTPVPTNTQGNIYTGTAAPYYAVAPNNSDPEYFSGIGRGGYIDYLASPVLIVSGAPGLIIITW